MILIEPISYQGFRVWVRLSKNFFNSTSWFNYKARAVPFIYYKELNDFNKVIISGLND
jgi:hypothetical protein